MSKKFLVDIDLQQNELKSAVVENLATAPLTPKPGQHYFNITDNTEYFWDGTKWVNCSGDFNFTNGIEQDGRNVQIAVATGEHAGNVVLTADTNGLSADVDLSGKVDKLETKPTAGDYTKVTINAEGQVTAGTTLAESDIPDLHLAKITDVTATAAEVNKLAGLTTTATELGYVHGVTSAIQDQLDAKLGLDSLSIASTSTNYLEYDNTNGQFGAKVDTNVTANSTNLVTSGAVKAAIDAAITGGVHYVGTWDITSATDYSDITLPQTKGALFYVTGTGPKTIGGIEWNQGDYLLLSDNCDTTADIATYAQKVDNTESSDIVRLNATQTLTNKTIDADNNTISNLETDNLKSGVLQTAIRATASASDTALASEKAIATALDDKQDKVATAVENNIATWDAAGNTKDSGKAFTTSVRASTNASDDAIATEKAVATFVETSMSDTKATVTNGALTPVSGVATWSITNLAGDPYAITIIETATGEEVVANIVFGTKSATIKMNAASAIAADTYTAKILM